MAREIYALPAKSVTSSVVFTQPITKNCVKTPLARLDAVLIFTGVINPSRVALNNL